MTPECESYHCISTIMIIDFLGDTFKVLLAKVIISHLKLHFCMTLALIMWCRRLYINKICLLPRSNYRLFQVQASSSLPLKKGNFLPWHIIRGFQFNRNSHFIGKHHLSLSLSLSHSLSLQMAKRLVVSFCHHWRHLN